MSSLRQVLVQVPAFVLLVVLVHRIAPPPPRQLLATPWVPATSLQDHGLPPAATTPRPQMTPRASQPTPEDWKALGENDKRAWMTRNYGSVADLLAHPVARAHTQQNSPPPPPPPPPPPLPPRVGASSTVLLASREKTPENWKELSEDKKRVWIQRNYGSGTPAVSRSATQHQT